MSCPFRPSETAAGEESAEQGRDPLTYGSYLQVDKLLGCMAPESEKRGSIAHDEMLFITIHQTYELWFRQLIFEMDSIRELFSNEVVLQRQMLIISSRLERMAEILTVLVRQILILDTMTPWGFLEFRNLLSTSSGFQSAQFRVFENKLGLDPENRIKYNAAVYTESFQGEEKEAVLRSEKEPSLRKLIEAWLERTPGLEETGFDFWTKLEKNYALWRAAQRVEAEAEPIATVREQRLRECTKLDAAMDSLFDPDQYAKSLARRDRSLSHAATKGALMIYLYRDQPLFHQPYMILSALQKIDGLLIQWRMNHALVVQKQIGNKIGSGGSSGYHYLRATVSDRYKIFLDFNNLSTFLVPESVIPKIDRKFLLQLSSLDLDEEAHRHAQEQQSASPR